MRVRTVPSVPGPVPGAAEERRRRSVSPVTAAFVAACLLQAGTAAGCMTDPPTVTPVPPTSDPYSRITPSPEARAIALEVKTSVIGPGFDRFAFVLKNEQGSLIEDAEVLTVFYNQAAKSSTGLQRSASGPAVLFGRELPGGGSRWVTYVEFDMSGAWSVDATVQFPDGSQGLARGDFTVAGRGVMPSANQPAPGGDTPVLPPGGDLTAITSDPSPVAELYQLSVPDAVKNGKPTVVQFSSPGRCPDAACLAPIEALKQALTVTGGGVNVIHVESRDAKDPAQLSAAAKAWGLPSDPWTFVFGKRGLLYARVEGPLGVDELKLLLEKATAQP